MCLRLKNDSGDTRFLWQDWLDAAMGCMKGFEEGENGGKEYGQIIVGKKHKELRYERNIVRVELGAPMVELCSLRVDKPGIERVVQRTRTVRVWTGWPTFDVRICKFEVDQWLHACNIDFRNWRACYSLSSSA